MKLPQISSLAALAVSLMAAGSVFGAPSLRISPNSTTAAASAVEADYSSIHLYVDEVNGDSIPITVFYVTGTNAAVDEADIFTNLNNRDKANLDANGDGIPDAIVPPNGNLILAGDTNNYFTAVKMNLVSGGFQATIYATKTGAYRLTARYHLAGDGTNTWHYYNDSINGSGINYRDAAIVVSPTKARAMVTYEANIISVNANKPSNGMADSTQRSTFDDMDGGPNATTHRPVTLSYLQGLGVNWLWLQPIHPIGVEGRESGADYLSGTTGYPVGSPYSVKNFFAVNPLLSKTYTPGSTSEATGRANALIEFQRFMKATDAAGINVMLDVPFNHTSFDCELGDIGQTLFGNVNTTSTSLMENTEARIYSRWNGGSASQTDSNNLGLFDYGERASGASSIALACDRFDFGKFVDVHDVYFGRYAALVYLNNDANKLDYLNERDWFDYSQGNDSADGPGNGHFDQYTQNVWKYFADYIPFWLQQTGHTTTNDGTGTLQGNSTLSDPVARRAADDRGLDGIRADFAQGLPPQCWEYIVNTARSYKWDFIFLAESLDGGPVTYRSSRHFDVLNDSVLFPLYDAITSGSYRALYDSRRTSYGQSMMLWDTESHDEAGYSDPYQALVRYAVNSTIDGVPDVFNGQEIGISGAVASPSSNAGSAPHGFTYYQTNFGKSIPHFMVFNSLDPAWTALGQDSFGEAQLYPVYAGIGRARASSPALQSSNRYYLNYLHSSDTPSNIFAVAKYVTANASPNNSEVVFGFVNLDRNNTQTATFGADITLNGTNNLFGIDPARTYNIKNIAADTSYDSTRANTWLWGAPGRSGTDVLQNGIFVSLNPVPSGTSGWVTNPYEAQYLKLYDVTPPPAPSAPKAYAIGSTTNISWTGASDPEGGISGYQVTVSTGPNGSGTTVFSGPVSGTSVSVTGTYGQTFYTTVTSVNNAGISGSTSSTGGTLLLDPNGDYDGDGVANAAEDNAGTSPLDNSDYFHIKSTAATPSGFQITWASVPGVKYQVQSSTSVSTGYTPLSGVLTAGVGQTSMSYTDVSGTGRKLFYEVTTVP